MKWLARCGVCGKEFVIDEQPKDGYICKTCEELLGEWDGERKEGEKE